ncbi:sigma 54-interacting transcriptional regulator [Desulfopila aestuarii]|uniref:HTH-type transcriptional regulatory protein TyrR n=1 Tax=Desulfopila aestuarii DSM 18488 TaxID=1121416 RepID=A0A1M7YG99_9BACT|nr:sigma 54-interacting transcriptional regulator [Desulfopila aestuarii]SHO51650.1 PAS domain S-box-containing protein [Desulfopila aestuarii DSM 18488]
MHKNNSLTSEIEALISNPPPHWQVLCQAIVDVSRNCVLAVDRRGCIFVANAIANEKFGAAVRKLLKDIIPSLMNLVDKTLMDGRRRVVPSMQVGSNEYRIVVNPLKLQAELVGAICLLEESTEFEEVAKQMRFFQHLTSELEAIIDSSSDGLFVCDANANVIRVNPASERIHKISATQLIGKNMVDLIAEGFIDKSAALQAIEKKKTVSLLQEKDNRKIISIGTPVFDNNGSLISVVVSERDITEIDNLHRELEEQGSLTDQLQSQLLQMQLADLKTHKIIARSPSMIKVLEKALKVSTANSTVLITGESGVGKGLITNLIHKNSSRAQKPLIRINCGAIPESLIESELFGYEEGAFTGAKVGGKPGSLELADGGSLFLDEIGELPLSSQVKLLRFLEKGRLTRVGGTKVINVNARILVATHRNLQDMVAKGTFRQDLYYRLSVIPLHVPALRERKDCILPLVRYYFDYFGDITKTRKRVSRAALDALLSYSYPGNVRELMNICEHAIVMSDTDIIDQMDLPKDVRNDSPGPSILEAGWPKGLSLKQILENVERKVILQTLQTYKNQGAVAAVLGVSQPTIARRIKKLNIK